LPVEAQESSGEADTFEKYRRFLHAFLVTPSRDDPPQFLLAGWYYRSGDAWFSARVTHPDGSDASVAITREASPDIAETFYDGAARAQRFTLKSDCVRDCSLELRTPEGATIMLQPSTLHDESKFRLGPATIFFDRAIYVEAPRPSRRAAMSAQIRTLITGSYSLLVIPVCWAGLIAFTVSTVLYSGPALSNSCYIMALALWVLVLARVTLLVLITATSFPALIPPYLAPAYFLLIGAVVFSVGSLVQLARRMSARVAATVIDAPTANR